MVYSSGHGDGPGLIKSWTRGVPVEVSAAEQLDNAAQLPFIHKHIAVMPDVHWGMGATVGSVIPTRGAIVPAAVGVDIGCGMMAQRINLKASQLPDNLFAIRSAIEAAVPHGRTDNGGVNDRGSWHDIPDFVVRAWESLAVRWMRITAKHPAVAHVRSINQLGSLGTGNHFIELCLDENQDVWVMLHSGSRGAGNKIGTYFISRAKQTMEKFFIHLPDKDLAYLVESTEDFHDYVEAVGWAQEYAALNRRIMMGRTLNAIGESLGGDGASLVSDETAVNCHHNYIAKEHHFGADVWVTRKGAVRARTGDLGIIPGSMGAKSFIVRGKGNPDSFCSCSHGAGRRMSRTEAKKRFTIADHEAATAGVECRKDADVIDETPAAYKSIDDVMSAQADLVDIVHTLKQVICVKG